MYQLSISLVFECLSELFKINTMLLVFYLQVSRIEIKGLKIVGPNKNITKEEAMADRLIKSNYFKGRGIAIWSGISHFIFNNKRLFKIFLLVMEPGL